MHLCATCWENLCTDCQEQEVDPFLPASKIHHEPRPVFVGLFKGEEVHTDAKAAQVIEYLQAQVDSLRERLSTERDRWTKQTAS